MKTPKKCEKAGAGGITLHLNETILARALGAEGGKPSPAEEPACLWVGHEQKP